MGTSLHARPTQLVVARQRRAPGRLDRGRPAGTPALHRVLNVVRQARQALEVAAASITIGNFGRQPITQRMILRGIETANALDDLYADGNPTGRETLAKYLIGGRVLFSVDRAADIRQILDFSRKHGLRPIVVGGAEAWRVAPQLAAAKVPVILNTLQNLPGSFDQIGARLDNAALLHKAGVQVIVSDFDFASHNARKVRQDAGVAVANGLPWESGLAAITSVPAAAFGVGDQVGRIEPGLVADLVLWNGDPLELTTTAEQVWMRGQAMPMRSRQTELRDRYLQAPGALPRAYQH